MLATQNGRDRAHVVPATCRFLDPSASWREVEAGLWVAVVTYTPDLAGKILKERNTHNRRRVVTQIAMLSQAMSDGYFRLTGEPVIFNSDGVLTDGQNRLSASVASGKSFRSLTVVGVEPSVFDVTGQGSRRSLSQVLDIMKEPNPSALAPLLYAIPTFFSSGKPTTEGHCKRATSIPELVDGLRKWPGARASAAFAYGFKSGGNRQKPSAIKFGGCGTVAVLHWVFSQVDEPFASDFLSRVILGTAGDDPNWQPALKLSQTLEANLSESRVLARGLTEVYTVMAWNAIFAHRQVKLYRFTPDMAYPQVYGWDYVDGKPFGVAGKPLNHDAAEGDNQDDAF